MAEPVAPRSVEFDLDRLASIDAHATVSLFEHAGYLPLPGLLPPPALEAMRAEVGRLLDHAKRRDFDMTCMGGTPRHMTTLGGLEIASTAPAVASLYRDDALLSALGRLVGMELRLADDPVERHVLNVLHRPGDTHGLHTDDYPIALVLFIESPRCETGCGHLEFFDACRPGERATKMHPPGDAYVLRADRFPHRVQPIHDGCQRTVLNFAYGAAGVPVSASPSASILYA